MTMVNSGLKGLTAWFITYFLGLPKKTTPRVLDVIPANTKHFYNNVGPTSKTLGRRCINAIQMFCVCWDDMYS